VVGGYLTDVTWRWCFIINVPIGVIAVVVTFIVLRSMLIGPKDAQVVVEGQTTYERRKSSFFSKIAEIDIGGQLLFLAGAVLFILAITWGGATFPWDSAAVLIPLAIGATLFLAFPVYEFFMSPGKRLANFFPRQTAMVPFRLLATRNISILCYINFATGMGMNFLSAS
jgi:MFS family permease